MYPRVGTALAIQHDGYQMQLLNSIWSSSGCKGINEPLAKNMDSLSVGLSVMDWESLWIPGLPDQHRSSLVLGLLDQ